MRSGSGGASSSDEPAEMEVTVLELLDDEIDDADAALLAEPIEDAGPTPVVDDDPTLTGEGHRREREESLPAPRRSCRRPPRCPRRRPLRRPHAPAPAW